MTPWIPWVAIFLSVFALIVAVRSYYASIQSNKTAIFDRRFEVYSDCEKFLNIWARDGCPDMQKLPMLVDAWNRSKFLFEDEVTQYLRLVWTDSCKADFFAKVIDGKAKSDRDKAIDGADKLFRKHTLDRKKFNDIFLKQMKIK